MAVNTQNYHQETIITEFFAAVEQQDMKAIEEHIKNGVNIKKKNLDGLNPLHMAAQIGNSRMVDLFLAKGVGINVLATRKRTALHIAVEQQHIHIAERLLKYGAKINTHNSVGDSPLHEAIRRGNFDLVKLLVDNGADLNVKLLDMTPLILALKIFDVPIINYLLNHGAKAQGKDDEGDGLLHIAIKGAADSATRCKVVEALLAHGASINERGADQATALSLTLHRGDVQLVDLLIRSGADIHAKDSRGRSILQVAVNRNLNDVALKLLAMGANPNDFDCKYYGILANAIHLNNEQMVRTLLTYGADPNKKMAVHVAAENENEQIMKILVDHGANVNYMRKSGLTPLYRAIAFGQDRVVQYLLEKGADINKPKESIFPLRKAYTLFVAKRTNEKFNYTLAVMIAHIALLVAQGQYVHKENIQLIREHNCLNTTFDIYSKELTEMKKTKVKNANVTYFDLLIKQNNALIDYLRSKSVTEAIKRKDHRRLFPIYSRRLECHCVESMR